MDGKKIVLAGLDRAGKSSIIQRVFFNAYPEDLDMLKPTRGIEREEVKISENEDQFVFWELGGQSHYIADYPRRPQVFGMTELLLFVIDLQDDERYETAMDYLQELLRILRETSPDCHVTIILHKFDPDKANVLRNKQFMIFRLLKSVQSQYSNFNFSQHSTSIYDDTLYYTFQNIFSRFDINIGAYKTQLQTNISLVTNPQPMEKTKTQEVMSEELVNRFESIVESSKSGLFYFAPEYDNFSGINKLHKLVEKNIAEFHKFESVEKKSQAIDSTIMAYMEFIGELGLAGLKKNVLTEQEAQMIYIFTGQLNLVKVRFADYHMKTQLAKISNPLKFMEEIKQLTNELLDASFIVGSISLQQLQDLKQLLNGISNANFSLFSQDSQEVYTFTSIQELKSAFSQDKFVPAKLIIQVELAELLQHEYSNQIQTLIESGRINEVSIEAINAFSSRLDYLILEFYQWVLDHNLKEYDISRTVENKFHQLTSQLLFVSNLSNIFGEDERLQIKQILESTR